jgi:hypothetical protein
MKVIDREIFFHPQIKYLTFHLIIPALRSAGIVFLGGNEYLALSEKTI